MTHWLYNEFTKISTGVIIITQWIVHWEDIIDRFSSLLGLKKMIERRHKMANPIADVQLALTILQQIRQALPTAAKAIVDLKQAWADKSDPTKASNDLAQVLTDVEPLINQVLALVPPAATPPAA